MPEREIYTRIVKRKNPLNFKEWSIEPCTKKEATYIVKNYHRHNQPVVGYKMAIKLVDKNKVI